MSNPKARRSIRGSFSASALSRAPRPILGRLLLISLVLHAVVTAGLLIVRGPHLIGPIAPARVEILFGHADPQSAPATPGQSGDARPAQAGRDGVFTAGGTGNSGQTAPQPAPGQTDTPGVRIERPDAAVIPAKDDKGNRAPPYPAAAREAHIEGTVLIRLHISETGAVAWVEKLQSSGDASLDDAAETTLAHWHFLPARRDGVAVPSYRDQPVRFAIE